MRVAILLFTFLCSIGASAQCPVQVIKAYTRGYHRDAGRLETPSLKVNFRNVSEKIIVGTKFGASYTNAVDEERSSLTTYSTDDKVQPGKSKLVEFNQYDTTDIKKPNIYVLKVKFEDGTFWEDDGSRSCGVQKGE